jgi:hypothetical protein
MISEADAATPLRTFCRARHLECLAAQRKRYEYQAALEPMTRNGIGYEH